MKDMPVYLVAYDRQWPTRFAEERRRIVDVLGADVVTVEHIGSTAIPKMAAKPIIDIMVLVADIATAPTLFSPLAQLAYHYYPYAEDETPERRWFCKPNPTNRTHHLHLVTAGSEFHCSRLLFRDYLRAHPDDASRYESLKRQLAARYPRDRAAYTASKTQFIREILTRAQDWANRGRQTSS